MPLEATRSPASFQQSESHEELAVRQGAGLAQFLRGWQTALAVKERVVDG
jgi:hypothetical protein